MRVAQISTLAAAALLVVLPASAQPPIPVEPGESVRVAWDPSPVNDEGTNAPDGYRLEAYREAAPDVVIAAVQVSAETLGAELPPHMLPAGEWLLAVRAYNAAGVSERSNSLRFVVTGEEPTEPTDPADPTEPTEPTDPGEPIEPEPPDNVRPDPETPDDPPAPTDPAPVYEVQVFTESGVWTRPAGVTQVDVVVVGGGGGGGAQQGGGGGGAGGVRAEYGLDVSGHDVIPVTVGAGGAATSGGSVQGHDGEPSAFGDLLVAQGGGGGGGTGLKTAATLCHGRPGGSGGGSASTCQHRVAGEGVEGEGHAGGRAYYSGPSVGGSGGGGAMGPGTGGKPKEAGTGGPGVTYEMTDGLFAGARGGDGGGPGVLDGADGAPHTGDGGGGGGREGVNGTGGAGGSGVVIVRWEVPRDQQEVVYTVADDITTVRIPAHRHDVRICVEYEGEDASDVCVAAGDIEEPMPEDEPLEEEP